jgi:hypothetical protein
MELDGVLHQHADERHRGRAASLDDPNARPQILRTLPIDDRPPRDVADVIEESINSVVRESTHGWIEEHGGGLYSRFRDGSLSCAQGCGSVVRYCPAKTPALLRNG